MKRLFLKISDADSCELIDGSGSRLRKFSIRVQGKNVQFLFFPQNSSFQQKNLISNFYCHAMLLYSHAYTDHKKENSEKRDGNHL